MGGSEKTPLVLELLAYLESLGFKPALVTRGYKGKWEKEGGVLSDGKRLFGGWEEAGDEAYLAARRFPKAGVFIGKHRFPSCLRAREMAFEIVVLDDGFQHLKLGRSLDIVLHDLGARGALREGLSALNRADLLLLKKGGSEPDRHKIDKKRPPFRMFEYAVVSQGLRSLETGASVPVERLKGKAVLAFCGIARPERFFALLEECGIPAQNRMAFPDHFPFPQRALDDIAAACRSLKPDALVTTEKDAVKILGRSGLFAPLPVYVLAIGLDLPPAFFDEVRKSLPQAKQSGET